MYLTQLKFENLIKKGLKCLSFLFSNIIVSKNNTQMKTKKTHNFKLPNKDLDKPAES